MRLISASLAASTSIAACIATSAATPDDPLRSEFEHVSFDEGIAHDLVFCMHQDSVGFLWFGTMHGLIRYDGHEFVTFRHDPFDSTSISCDDVVCIAEDLSQRLWLGTYGGGLNRYDRAAGRFDRVLADGPDSLSLADGIVWDLAVARDGAVWAATGRGVDRVDGATLHVTHYAHDPKRPESLAPGLPRAVLVDRAGAVWIGTQGGGLDSLDAASQSFLHHRADAASSTSLPSDAILDLLEDREGTIWIATPRGAATRRLGTPGFALADSGSRMAQALHEESDGAIWIGGGSGLARIDPRSRVVARWTHDPQNSASLGGTTVAAVLRDRSGVLWVSCYLSGLDRLLPSGRRFPHFAQDFDSPHGDAHRRITAFHEDREGTLWIGTGAGLVSRAGVSGAWRRFDPKESDRPAAPPFGAVTAIVEGHDGALWIGTTGGLCRRDSASERFISWRAQGGEPLTTANVTALLVDHAGEIWVGTPMGLNRLVPAARTAAHFRHDEADSASLIDDAVISLFEDRLHRIWVGTYRGVSRLDAERGTFTHFQHDPRDARTIGNNYAYAMLETEDGTLWVGTAGGLERFEEAASSFTHVRERDGLPNPVVVSMLNDGLGALWLGTQLGLARYDMRTRQVTSFDIEDGLQSNLYVTGAAERMRDGTLLFGGVHGYNAFRPQDLERSAWAPPVAFTGLSVAGRAPSPWQDPSALRALRLSPHERTFTVEFAALDFRSPGRQRYAYRLEGLDRDWIDAGERRSATYSMVPPGSYTLRVRGSSADGVWNESGATLAIVAEPPFWKTNAFLAALAGAFIATFVLLHRLRVRTGIRRALEIERARAEEREAMRLRAASDFHDELGHRLARIGLFSELATRRTAHVPEDVRASLDRIGEEARRLADDARDFLGVLGSEQGTLGDLIARLGRFGEQLFERTSVEFRTEGSFDGLDDVRVSAEDRRNLLSIFKEAMTNALRHAKCGHVTLRVDARADRFTLALEDDGCGFPRTTAATGQGLRNMEWRAKRIASTIEIASRPGGGTTVALTRKLGPIPES